jgi:hypothetical protein
LPPGAVVVVEIMGQSNSWGTQSFLSDVPMGVIDDVGDSYIWDKIGGITALTHVDDGAWTPLTVGFGRSGPQSFGPEMVLAQKVYNKLQRPVYVIKCCRGQTLLADRASEVDWNANSVGEMFDLWREYYHRPAMQQLAQMHGAENVYYLGLNWFQGAADSRGLFNDPHLEYEQNLRDLLAAFRAVTVPNVAISVGRSENYTDPNYPFINYVRAAQVTVADSTARCNWYSTNNRTLSSGEVLFEYAPDNHHFNGLGQLDLGNAMGRTLLRMGLFVPAF